jgi:hypothetical protein
VRTGWSAFPSFFGWVPFAATDPVEVTMASICGRGIGWTAELHKVAVCDTCLAR